MYHSAVQVLLAAAENKSDNWPELDYISFPAQANISFILNFSLEIISTLQAVDNCAILNITFLSHIIFYMNEE